LFAIVILATWRTSSWIGVDGVISGYRQRRQARADADSVAIDAGPGASRLDSRAAYNAATKDNTSPKENEPVSVR
jgi:hypothetical protein